MREHGRPDRPAVVPPPQRVPACRAAFRSEMPDAYGPARSRYGAVKNALVLPCCDLPWTSTEPTIRSRACGLALAGTAPNQRRSRDQVHPQPSTSTARGRHSGDLDFRSWLLLRMCIEICAQRANDRNGGFPAGRALSIHRETCHVSAERTGRLSFEHDWIMRRHHSTPASLRMRFPSRPASWPCMVTQISFQVTALS